MIDRLFLFCELIAAINGFSFTEGSANSVKWASMKIFQNSSVETIFHLTNNFYSNPIDCATKIMIDHFEFLS